MTPDSPYRRCLRDHLVDRASINPAYSLRAMARDLQLAPSFLSEVMSGSKNLSLAAAHRVALSLGLAQTDAEIFVLQVQLEAAAGAAHRSTLIDQIARLIPPESRPRDLQVDAFRTISEWYHFVIAEMFLLEGVDGSPKNIARLLDISPAEAAAAIDRLERLGILESAPNTAGAQPAPLKRSTGAWQVNSPEKNQALQNFHRKMLYKAIESLQTQTPREKFIGSETIAFDPQLLPEANEIIERCFRDLKQLAAAPGRSDSKKSAVYHLGIQFFSLFKKGKSL